MRTTLLSWGGTSPRPACVRRAWTVAGSWRCSPLSWHFLVAVAAGARRRPTATGSPQGAATLRSSWEAGERPRTGCPGSCFGGYRSLSSGRGLHQRRTGVRKVLRHPEAPPRHPKREVGATARQRRRLPPLPHAAFAKTYCALGRSLADCLACTRSIHTYVHPLFFVFFWASPYSTVGR